MSSDLYYISVKNISNAHVTSIGTILNYSSCRSNSKCLSINNAYLIDYHLKIVFGITRS